MGKVNVALKGASIIVTHWIILFDILRTRNALRRIFKNFKVVDAEIKHWKSTIGIRQDLVNVALIILAYIMFVATSEIAIMVFIARSEDWWWYWYSTILSISVNRLRHLQNVQLVEELTARYRAVRKEMETLADCAKSSLEIGKCIQLSNRVTEILNETNGDISSVFGLSQLANLTQNFVQLSSDLYWMYGMIYSNQTSMLLGKFYTCLKKNKFEFHIFDF